MNVLVNNAGTIKRNDALDFTEADWDSVIDVNLKTVFFLSQAAARSMVRNETHGKIITIFSHDYDDYNKGSGEQGTIKIESAE